jgi:hypothetical protein
MAAIHKDFWMTVSEVRQHRDQIFVFYGTPDQELTLSETTMTNSHYSHQLCKMTTNLVVPPKMARTILVQFFEVKIYTIPPRVPENPAYRKPTHALHHNNVNICQEALKLSEYTLRTLALVSTYPLLLLSSVALTIPYLVVDVQNSLSSVSLGRAL